MSVYKPSKSRFWQYDFQHKGRRFHGSTGVETRRAAEAVERKLRQDAALGLLGDLAGITLDQAAGKWWLEVGRHLKTATDIERRIQTLLRILGRNTLLRDINARVIAEGIEKRRGETFARAAGKDAARYLVKNGTVNAEFVTQLSRILTRARKVWQVPGLPAIDWKSVRLPEPRPQPRTYTAAQRAAWRDQCDETAAFALDLLLLYGLRFQELFFPPDAYDPDGPRLLIPGAARKKDVMHLVPLRDEHARQIAARVGLARANRPAPLDTIWFERGHKGRLVPVTYHGLMARLRSAARRAGITSPRLLHGARHHVGMEMLGKTGNLRLTQQLLGHADIKSTLVYAHALEDDLRKALGAEARDPGVAAQSRNSPEPNADDLAQAVPQQARAGRRPKSS